MRPAVRAHLPRLIAPLLLAVAGLAHAQYSWIDEKGVRQLSDRPPPPNTPADKILKAPGKTAASPPRAEPAPESKSAVPPVLKTVYDKPDPRPLEVREAEFRKFLHETAKDDQHDKARYCQDKTEFKTALENKSRSLSWMSEEQRRGMIELVKSQLAKDCP